MQISPVVIRAAISDKRNSLQFGGDGCSIVLEVPETDKVSALPLVKMQGRVLKVTVEVIEQ